MVAKSEFAASMVTAASIGLLETGLVAYVVVIPNVKMMHASVMHKSVALVRLLRPTMELETGRMARYRTSYRIVGATTAIPCFCLDFLAKAGVSIRASNNKNQRTKIHVTSVLPTTPLPEINCNGGSHLSCRQTMPHT